MIETTRTILYSFKRSYSIKSHRTATLFASKSQDIHSLQYPNTLVRVFVRLLGSSQGSVEKDGPQKKDDIKFPERTVTVYTCDKIYDKWRENKTFFKIPKSGVFAKISYIDTEGRVDDKDGKPPKTVMCIHGIPGNYGVFSHLINALSKEGIRVIVPTFPGTLYLPGKYQDELFRHSIEEKIQVFQDFLKALEISEIDCIVAHSSAIYPSLPLVLDPNLKVKCQVLFNTGGHKKPITMKPYWIIWACTHLYLNSYTRIFIQKCGRFIMKYILRTPIKDDNIDGIALLAVTMVFSKYWKTKDLFAEVSRKKIPTLYCFSEDDKVVERKLTYEVVSLLSASKENIDYYDEEAKLQKKGKNLPWLKLLSFKEGSHYVFRKHPEICNQKVLELLKGIKT